MKGFIPRISIEDYDYNLSDDRIAKYPVSPKHDAKMLVFDSELGLRHDRFLNLSNYLVSDTLMVVNNTKVIPARLWFQKEDGAWIQVFLLKPLNPSWTQWHVMVGNRRKFKSENRLHIKRDNHTLYIEWLNRDENTIQFESSGRSIPEWIELLGEIPLPPYLNREAEDRDKEDYQAIFAKNKGAVAAPTASLHFTQEVMDSLNAKGVKQAEATLHVGAGTFKPVEVTFVDEHEMHAEQFEVTTEFLATLLSRDSGVLAIGTTACRLLESLPILGAKLILGELEEVFVSSEDGYREDIRSISTRESLNALYEFSKKRGGVIRGETQIFMIPGFDFRVTQSMVTNFHQPKSTLMLLIAAFVGEKWKDIYAVAVAEGYRFLSYGDGSLLKGKKNISW